MDLVFGDGRAAERAVRRLNGVHAAIRGEALDEDARRLAESYRALDPKLLLWVQVTLIMTSVDAYQRWVRPLSYDELDRFWQEARSVGVRLGISLSQSPADWKALTDYWDRMLADDGPIHATPTARRLSPLIVRPPIPFLPAFVVDLLALPGIALLPPRLRAEFGINWSRRHDLLAQLIGLTVKGWTHVVPGRLRQMPQAGRAFRRAAESVRPG